MQCTNHSFHIGDRTFTACRQFVFQCWKTKSIHANRPHLLRLGQHLWTHRSRNLEFPSFTDWRPTSDRGCFIEPSHRRGQIELCRYRALQVIILGFLCSFKKPKKAEPSCLPGFGLWGNEREHLYCSPTDGVASRIYPRCCTVNWMTWHAG